MASRTGVWVLYLRLVAPEGQFFWPAGSIALTVAGGYLLFARVVKRSWHRWDAPPLRPRRRGYMTLTGMIMPDDKVVRSPYTGREGVAFVVCHYSSISVATWVARPFRVRQPGGDVVRIWLPLREAITTDGPRQPIDAVVNTPEVVAFWRSALQHRDPDSLSEARFHATLHVMYEQCFAPGDDITMTAFFRPIRPPPGEPDYDAPTFTVDERADFVVHLGIRETMGRLRTPELNFLRAWYVGLGLFFELGFTLSFC